MKKYTRKKRMIYIGKKPDQHYWTEMWSEFSFQEKYEQAKAFPFVTRLFFELLEEGAKIVEAGCGLGQWVRLLSESGFHVVGVDFCKEIIEKTKKEFNLPVVHGDIFRLNFPDGAFDAYVSFGVVEHYKEGPDQALQEANRVLKPGGYLFISVPYINPLRMLKKSFRIYPKQSNNCEGDFYEYIFSKREFTEILNRHGFRILKDVPMNALQGLADEFIFSWKGSYKKGTRKGSLKAFIKRFKIFETKLFRRMFGHMILFAAQKK